MLLDRPLTVVVAAAPHQDVEDIIAQLDDPTGHIKVLRVETVEQLMTTIDCADVVIIDDRLPSENEGRIVGTCGPFDLVRKCKLGERVGLIGVPMSVRREWMAGKHRGTDGYSFVLMHVQAVCSGRMIYGISADTVTSPTSSLTRPDCRPPSRPTQQSDNLTGARGILRIQCTPDSGPRITNSDRRGGAGGASPERLTYY